MSVLAELAEVIAEAGEEGAETAAEIGASSEADLGELAEEMAADDSVEAKSVMEEEGVSKEFKEGQDEIMEEAKTGTKASILSRVRDLVKNMWNNKGAFAKMIGAEVAKGVLFTLGMKVIDSIWSKKAQNNPSPANRRRQAITRAILAERHRTDPIVKNWQLWMAKHFDHRESYGSITVDDVDITIFQILQEKISQAREYSATKVQEAVDAAKKSKQADKAEAILQLETEYVEKLVRINTTINHNGSSMMADGLKVYDAELDEAKKELMI
ncbi:hypothetical protein MAC_04509 [Metarhizium acridum CQMa 102]|uniref:Uncharacterized protein n=1 Tax=Metarhizium acridum (strain CQMa 102) TaxID=655827 RepID=E9E3R5_METAQ|nr:uncharacterized protein MAC_04509 [Metarhizium acridum CQMa 102]EFY89490.1 hypothetical protein MAC_04509 [Metarhizium acridum CQMa 102]